MEDMHNTELGLRLGYLNKNEDVTNSGMQALIVNSCASMMKEGDSAIGMLNSDIEQYYRYMDKGAVGKPFTLADFRYIVYNIVSGNFPACPDEAVYLTCANSILDFMSRYREIKFSELNRDFEDILIPQIEQEKQEMAMLRKQFDSLYNIAANAEIPTFPVVVGFHNYYDLFTPLHNEAFRSSYLYKMGYIQGKRDERARRKKAAEKAQA